MHYHTVKENGHGQPFSITNSGHRKWLRRTDYSQAFLVRRPDVFR